MPSPGRLAVASLTIELHLLPARGEPGTMVQLTFRAGTTRDRRMLRWWPDRGPRPPQTAKSGNEKTGKVDIVEYVAGERAMTRRAAEAAQSARCLRPSPGLTRVPMTSPSQGSAGW